MKPFIVVAGVFLKGQFLYVAFTPKGGCPLKLPSVGHKRVLADARSIHPQGWVLVRETVVGAHSRAPLHGWV